MCSWEILLNAVALDGTGHAVTTTAALTELEAGDRDDLHAPSWLL